MDTSKFKGKLQVDLVEDSRNLIYKKEFLEQIAWTVLIGLMLFSQSLLDRFYYNG